MEKAAATDRALDELLDDDAPPASTGGAEAEEKKAVDAPKPPQQAAFVSPAKKAKGDAKAAKPVQKRARKADGRAEAPKKKRARRSTKTKAHKRRGKKADEEEDSESQAEVPGGEGDDDDDDDGGDGEDGSEDDEGDPEDEDVAGKGYSLVVAFTSVPSAAKRGLMTTIKAHGGHMTKELGLATHVVCAQPQRTIKLMCAILRGLWVLSDSWVRASEKKSAMAPEEEHELKDYPGIRASRTKHAEPGFTVCSHPRKESTARHITELLLWA